MTTIKKTEIKPLGKKSAPKTEAVKIKKAASKKAKYEIKYSDKSEGQPELVDIFNKIKALMKPYVKGTVREIGEKPGIYNLISEKAIEVEGRKRNEVYFATIMVQKGFVGFYFMPVYMNNKSSEIIKPELMKCLKGKACFHIKKWNEQIFEQIEDALKLGYKAYAQKGWIE